MPSAPAAERLFAAQSDLRLACELLISPTPEALNRCQHVLHNAVLEVTEYRSQSPDRAATAGLRAEVLRAGKLLQNLARFYRGWERVLGTMSGGYLAGGSPAPFSRTGRICYRG